MNFLPVFAVTLAFVLTIVLLVACLVKSVESNEAGNTRATIVFGLLAVVLFSAFVAAIAVAIMPPVGG